MKIKKLDKIIFEYQTALTRKSWWKVDYDILLLELCQEYGWSWQELMEAPPYIVDLCIAKMSAKIEIENKKSTK